MVIQRNAQLEAHVRELSRIDVENLPRDLHRALKASARRLDPVSVAAGLQDLAIKGDVVRHDVIEALKEGRDFRPELTKGGRLRYVLPGQSMNVREDDVFARRANQFDDFLGNDAVLDTHEPNGKSTVRQLVAGLKVNREELAH